jgi:hypothetical protein
LFYRYRGIAEKIGLHEWSAFSHSSKMVVISGFRDRAESACFIQLRSFEAGGRFHNALTRDDGVLSVVA